MRIILFIFAALSTQWANSQELNVGIMRGYDLTAVRIGHNNGNYKIYGDTTEITTIWKDQSVYFRRSGDGVKVEKSGKV